MRKHQICLRHNLGRGATYLLQKNIIIHLAVKERAAESVYISERHSLPNIGVNNMDDINIIKLFLNRDEQAIMETDNKYGGYCFAIAYNILADHEDSEECVSDTYHSAWNSIPPRKPNPLAPFLGKIVRNISIDRWRKNGALKRGGGQIMLALEELKECTSCKDDIEKELEQRELICAVRRFVSGLPDTERKIFVCRYWYMDPISDIAARFGFTDNKVSLMLSRIRAKLQKHLMKEGLL